MTFRRRLWMPVLAMLVVLAVACAAEEADPGLGSEPELAPTTSEAEEYTEAGTAFCDVHLSDLTDGLAELARLAKEWDDYTAGADTGLLTDDELWDLWGLVYTDLVREDWGVRDARASIDRVCLFDDQEAWEQEAQALRAASHELNSGFRPLCPVLFASIMENSVYGNSVDACETLHSTWPYPLVDT